MQFTTLHICRNLGDLHRQILEKPVFIPKNYIGNEHAIIKMKVYCPKKL